MPSILMILFLILSGIFLFFYRADSDKSILLGKCLGGVFILLGLLAFYLVKVECIVFTLNLQKERKS